MKFRVRLELFMTSIDPKNIPTWFTFVMIGIMFLVFPSRAHNTIPPTAGSMLIILGAYRLIVFVAEIIKEHRSSALLEGGVMIAAGIVVLTEPQFFKDMLTVFVGITIILAAVEKVQQAIKAIRLDTTDYWWVLFAIAAVYLALGLTVLVCPLAETAMSVFTGSSLLTVGVGNIASDAYFYYRLVNTADYNVVMDYIDIAGASAGKAANKSAVVGEEASAESFSRGVRGKSDVSHK